MDWSVVHPTEIVVGILMLIGTAMAAWFAARASVMRVTSSNRRDDSEAAAKYQEMAEKQADINIKQGETFKQQLEAQGREFMAKIAEQNVEIHALKLAVVGPWELRIIAQTHPQPQVIEATIRLAQPELLIEHDKEDDDAKG